MILLLLGLARIGPSRTVRMVLDFYRTGPFMDGPGPQTAVRGPVWSQDRLDGPIPSVFWKIFTFYASLGPEITYARPNIAVPDVFLAVRTLPALRTTVLDHPERPDGPKSGRSSGLDGTMIPDRPRTIRDRTVQNSWVRTVPILSARASPNYYLSFFFNTK